MRIADVCGFYSPAGGGVRAYVDQKFTAARRHGHDLTVIAPGAQTRIDARPGGRVVWLESPVMPFDPAYRRFARQAPVWRALDAAAPDVVEGSSPWRSGWLAAKWPGKAARVFVFHQDFVAAYPRVVLGGLFAPEAIDRLFAPWWARLRALSGHFDATIVGGDWLARRLEGFGVKQAMAIPIGVEPGRFSPALRDEGLRRELLARCGVGAEGRLLLAVGRFHPEKRHATLIEGFVHARARSSRPLGLVLAGDGLTRRQVERAARRAGGVVLLGAVNDRDDLARLYASADALAHGSAAETYGIVVAEALTSGLPVVVPAAGGAADLARLGTSRLYPPGDEGALATALLDILESPRPGGSIAVPTTDQHFAALFQLYERLLQERSIAPDWRVPAPGTAPSPYPRPARRHGAESRGSHWE